MLLRPATLLDIVQPPFQQEPPTALLQLANNLNGQADIRLVAEGENLSGAIVSKTIMMTLSGDGTQSAEELLYDSAGLGVEPEGDTLIVSDLSFGGQAQKGGLDYDWQILAMERSVDRINPNWLILPLLAIVALVIALQRARSSRESV